MCKRYILSLIFLIPFLVFAQNTAIDTTNWKTNPGIIGTLILVLIVAFVAVIIMSVKISSYVENLKAKQNLKNGNKLEKDISNLSSQEIEILLKERKEALEYQIPDTSLSGTAPAKDQRGLINKLNTLENQVLFDDKVSHEETIKISPQLKQIVLYYLVTATFWLVFGTTVGQYVGLKFVFPELDSISWLSFGRLRPVHTNTVFWGWASLAMLGLGNFVIARTSSRELYSYKLAKIALILINATVFIGNIFLMSGINNGGGEYREYIWPVFLMFLLGVLISLYNFYKTVANRKISEIYISNWYILAALIWTGVLVTIGYLPMNYQNGLGETVIQGYYMHQGVGMWFMTFTLGLMYYYLPSAVNKPIYSYSLGVLAFWTQMLFYTMIGTHHFIFSPLPWWLQTVAIVFSMGMFIPVTAGTTNFLMTMRGSWSQISKSYVLPFFLVGIIYYFVGSAQGSFQAFRFTNYVWHFTDFNVAHSHITMYGIICFMLWGAIYFIVPKITGKQPKPIFVGSHFWLAFLGLFLYMTSLMIGGTYKGLSWIEGNPFIDSVILMREYWVWRAVGGTMMLLSHVIFAYNLYLMMRKDKVDKTQLQTSKI